METANWSRLALACSPAFLLLLMSCGTSSKPDGPTSPATFEEDAGVDISGPAPADPTQRLWYHRKKGNAGSSESMYEYAKMCLDGKGTKNGEKDFKEAHAWFEKAAAKGHADAMYSNGLMYYQGAGAKLKDFPEAIIWWEKAAELGQAEAMFGIGGLYYRGYREPSGKTVPADKDLAKQWYEKGAEKGNLECQNILGWMWSKGEVGEAGSKENLAQARKWYGLAAAQGSAKAKLALKELDKQE